MDSTSKPLQPVEDSSHRLKILKSVHGFEFVEFPEDVFYLIFLKYS